ncbi:MAG: heavy metal translocating P-type ATPase, partial [Cytophagales bacterium]
MVAVGKKILVKCYHCGDVCKDSSIVIDHKVFCCEGCKAVYGILQDNQMCEYYALESAPGAKIVDQKEYAFLEEPSIANSILNFKEGDVSGITFHIPSIHCSSCIWLLEHLHKLHSGIISSKIQFQQKKLDVQFKNTISLRKLAELLASIGYAPQIS